MSELASPDEARRRLEAVKAKRGYLLPHHGLLAITAPDLLEAYDATYTAMTLKTRTLARKTKEFIWIAILVAAEEAIATHHLKLFRDAGGTDAEIEMGVRLGAFAASAPYFRFVAEHWQHHLPGYGREKAYRAALDALRSESEIAAGTIEMAMAASHICRRQFDEVGWHIRGAYAAGVPELALAEAIAITMFPGSVPNFVDACGVWRDLIQRGEVAASESLRAWAEAPDGRGFDHDSP